MQDSLNVGENTPTRHHKEHNVSGTTQASFLTKFKATQNKPGQKRQHHGVYIYIYVYIIPFAWSMYLEESQLKRSVYQLVLPTRVRQFIIVYNIGRNLL